MSWLQNLFSPKPAEPPPHSVIIADDLVPELTHPGQTLSEVVDASLRAYLGAVREAEKKSQLSGIPFWLRRDSEFSGELEEQLRDRVSQRRSAEEQA